MTEETKSQNTSEVTNTPEKRFLRLNKTRKQLIENLRAIEMQMLGACEICGWDAERANGIINEPFFKKNKDMN